MSSRTRDQPAPTKEEPGGVKRMMKDQLRDFIDRISDTNHVSDDDVKMLQGEILRDGIASRLEVESLLALDRVVTTAESWTAALTKLVVDYVVWSRAPHGAVSNDDAFWLATLLEIGGPCGRGAPRLHHARPPAGEALPDRRLRAARYLTLNAERSPASPRHRCAVTEVGLTFLVSASSGAENRDHFSARCALGWSVRGFMFDKILIANR